MLQESEILNLILACGVAVFLLWNWKSLCATRHLAILAVGFFALLSGFVVTIIEGFVLPDLLNMAEHFLYAVGSAVVAFWSWKVFGKKKQSV